MHIIATWIDKDEPCYGLRESSRMVQLFPEGQEWHWVQQVFVLRGNAIAKYEHDFGPDGKFTGVQPIVLVSVDGELSVGECLEEAERNRHDTYWTKRAQELQESSTLIKDHIDQLDMTREYARRNHRTVKEITRGN